MKSIKPNDWIKKKKNVISDNNDPVGATPVAPSATAETDSNEENVANSRNQKPTYRDRMNAAREQSASLRDAAQVRLTESQSRFNQRVSDKYATVSQSVGAKAAAVQERIGAIDLSNIGEAEFYSQKLKELSDSASENFQEFLTEKLEFNRDVDDVLGDISNNSVPPENIESILGQCKAEAARQVIGAFALDQPVSEFDEKLASQYKNLSESYKEFGDRVDVRDHGNYEAMRAERDEAAASGSNLSDGYNLEAELDPSGSDIEHIVSAREQYDSKLARAVTTDSELVDIINTKENLVFTNRSVNRSKADQDLRAYIEEKGIPIEGTTKLELEVSGKTLVVDKDDIDSAYEQIKSIKEEHNVGHLQSMGFDVASSGSMLAIKRIVGCIIYETHDVFFEEMRDLIKSGVDFTDTSYAEYIQSRSLELKEKVQIRLEERGVMKKAKDLGLEGFVAGTLGVLPMLVLSTIAMLPAFILTIIRECTLALVRSVRIFIKGGDAKLDKIRIVLVGAVSAVVGLYISNVIRTALAAVPGANVFSFEIASVMTAVMVTLVSLLSIYCFVQNKERISMMFGSSNESVGDSDPVA